MSQHIWFILPSIFGKLPSIFAHFHPKNPNLFIYSIGGSIILEDINDRHKQDFLRGHDMGITALAVSNSGND